MIGQSERKCHLNLVKPNQKNGKTCSKECEIDRIADIVGDVSMDNGLEELWSLSQPQLQLHIDNWKMCKNMDFFAGFM